MDYLKDVVAEAVLGEGEGGLAAVVRVQEAEVVEVARHGGEGGEVVVEAGLARGVGGL